MMTADRIKRFWDKVDKTESCWLWTSGKSAKGYGRFHCPGWHEKSNTMVAAHRFSWVIANGVIPHHDSHHGMCVLHKCDTPACVNPEHLFLGTNEENVKDMDSKKRRKVFAHKGSDHANSKLSESDVREIRRLHNECKITQTEISKIYKVCLSTINHIFTGRLWSHVK